MHRGNKACIATVYTAVALKGYTSILGQHCSRHSIHAIPPAWQKNLPKLTTRTSSRSQHLNSHKNANNAVQAHQPLLYYVQHNNKQTNSVLIFGQHRQQTRNIILADKHQNNILQQNGILYVPGIWYVFTVVWVCQRTCVPTMKSPANTSRCACGAPLEGTAIKISKNTSRMEGKKCTRYCCTAPDLVD